MNEISLIHWSEMASKYVQEAVNAKAVSFGIGDGKVEIRLHENGHEITIKAYGPIIIRPDVSNQIHIGVLKP